MEDSSSPSGTPGAANLAHIDAYLRALFADKPPESYILIWTLPDKRSRWFKDLDNARAVVEELEKAGRMIGIYAGVGLRPERVAKQPDAYKKRGVKDDISGAVGVWADIDIAGPGHKNSEKCPKDLQSALMLIEKTGVKPSLVIHSGGGLQAYWLFREPWLFDDDPAGRSEAYDLSKAWTRKIQAHAEALGFSVDGTFDLTRVLRIPGTTNRKPEMPVPVPAQIDFYDPELRYDPSELRDAIDPGIFDAASAETAAIVERVERVKVQGGSALVVDTQAQYHTDKFEALCEIEPRFKLSWLHKRTDLKDQSPSGWDMSLASFAAATDWTDQEIINLLIHHRRKWGFEIKRADYFVRTVGLARATVNRSSALDELKIEHGPRPADEAPRPMDNARRAAALDLISDALGVRISKILRYSGDPPEFHLHSTRGDITLGGVENLIGQAALRNKLAAAAGHYFPNIKKDDWDALAIALLDACETIHTGPESTDVGAAHIWLAQYLEEMPPGELSSLVLNHQIPFYKPGPGEIGKAYIFLASFKDWVFRRLNEKVTGKRLGVVLRKAGCEPAQVRYEDELSPKPSTRHVWQVVWTGTRPGSNGQHEPDRRRAGAEGGPGRG